MESRINSIYLDLKFTWKSFSEIDFNTLPNQFVLKTNHGSSTNIIVTSKFALDYNQAEKSFTSWMNTNFGLNGSFELQYKNIPKKIIAENYIRDSNNVLKDYKIICFNGKVYYVWVDIGRYEMHYRSIYDLNWRLQPWSFNNFKASPEEIQKPDNFKEMIHIAHTLCQGFSHVRVDLYNVACCKMKRNN